MTWVKIDDTITEHPKFVGLSDAGWTLWVHGLAYAGRNLSDGLIPAGMLNRLCNTRNPRKTADELVKAGLWDTSPDGWLIHDYLEHQRSADSTNKHKKASARGAEKGNHTRWHVKEGKFDPKCQWCVSVTDEPLNDDRSEGDSVNGQQSKRDIEKNETAEAGSSQTSTSRAVAERTRKTVDLMVDARMERATDTQIIDDLPAYRATVRRDVIATYRDGIEATAKANPAASPAELMTAALGAYDEATA